MPSPIGHALGGIAVAWGSVPRRNWKAAAILAAVALAPDLDLLIGDHRGISHSIGAAVLAGAVASLAAVLRKGVRPGSDPFFAARWGAAVGVAYASHIFFDWLSNDTRPPIGVMALWPITRDYYKAAIEIFPPVSRRCCDVRFWQYNLGAAIVELAIMTPVLLLALRMLREKESH